KSSQERLSAIANRNGDPQVPLVGRVRGYPEGFVRAIDKAMSIFPRDRIQSVAEWQAILREDGARALPTPIAAAPRVVDGATPVVPTLVQPEPAPAAPPADITVTTPGAPDVQALPAKAQAPRGPRDLLVSSTAAVLLLAGLLSLPGDLVQRLMPGNAQPVLAQTATDSIVLPGGLTFRTVATETGFQTIVADLGDGTDSDLQVGDVLLVYAATGEALGSETSLADILRREIAKNVATYGFAVQRKGDVAVGSFRMPGLTEADLKLPELDVETKT
ncbi:MAG: hypothetical protein NTW20_12115, partial [Rhodobacterales bacterium]|nr:hypothetical protein [Rhodobacterales bacterium]